jgi:hypothetical protein
MARRGAAARRRRREARPEGQAQQQLGRHGEDEQGRRGDEARMPSARRQHRPRIEPGRRPPGRLGQQVQPDADRHPHHRLGGHRRRGVGAGRVAAQLVLGQDHVDVLQRREQEEADDRHPPVAHERAQRAQRLGDALHRPHDPDELALEPQRHEDEGERQAQERAGHAEADADEHEGASESDPPPRR